MLRGYEAGPCGWTERQARIPTGAHTNVCLENAESSCERWPLATRRQARPASRGSHPRWRSAVKKGMFAFVHRLNKCLPRASPRLSVLGPRRLWGRAGSARSGEALASPALWGRLPVCLGAWPLLAPGDPDRPRSSPVRLGPETARSGRSAVTAGLSNCRARLRHGMPLGGVLGPWQPPWVLEGGAPLTLETSAAT